MYWVRQLRSTVRFADGVRELLSEPERVFLEVGPGRTLGTFVRVHPDRTNDQIVIPSMHHPVGPDAEVASVLNALGRMWLAGVDVDWARLTAHEQRRSVPLPTYPFEGQSYWPDPSAGYAAAEAGSCGDGSMGHGRSARLPARYVANVVRPFVTRLRSLLRWVLESSAIPGRRAPVDQYVAGIGIEEAAPTVARPRTDIEREVAAIWQSVLGLPAIGIHDDFFELGGTSLFLTRVMGGVNERWRVELPLVTILESPTVAGLAQCIAAVRPSSGLPVPGDSQHRGHVGG